MLPMCRPAEIRNEHATQRPAFPFSSEGGERCLAVAAFGATQVEAVAESRRGNPARPRPAPGPCLIAGVQQTTTWRGHGVHVNRSVTHYLYPPPIISNCPLLYTCSYAWFRVHRSTSRTGVGLYDV